ncbi:MAG: LysR family transcriptional regulator [Firmicutes bacterium]|nr:LysR family transcriptional regulator [Bacillota bacterium]
MEIRTLTTFLKVAETQSFTQAAALLGYSQSAVTIQIRQLEKELQVQLFDRIGKQVSLTDKGRQLLVYANTIIEAAEQASSLGHDDSEPAGVFRLGTVDSLAATILPDLLSELHLRHPLIRSEIVILEGSEIVAAPRQNQVDAVFTVSQPRTESDFLSIVEAWSPLRLIGCSDQFEPSHQFTPAELGQERFILTENQHSYRDYFERWLAQHDVHMEPTITMTNPQIIVELVSRGVGLSYLPEYTFQSALEEGRISVLDVPGLEFSDCIQLFHHRDKRVTAPMKAFFDLAREVLG